MFSDRLKAARKAKMLTQEQLAKLISVERSSIGKYESANVTPSPEVLMRMSSVLGVSVDYLLGNDARKHTDAHNILPIKAKKVPLLGEIACGQPIYADQQYGEFVFVSDDIDADFCLQAKGDSMIGARIQDGDIVFCQETQTVENGQIAAVIIGDEATLKRVYYYPEKNKLVLNSENPKYEPFVYVGEELNEICIIGRAVAFQSAIK